MKRLLLACFIFNSLLISGQITFSDQNIVKGPDSDSPTSIFSIDIDGDGDMDVLSASLADDKISWFENLDGIGTFGMQHVISSDADGARSVFAADFDGDGDVDVLSASENDHKVSWYENLDGNGNFGLQQNITTDTDYPQSVFAADIDGDGDMDVLSASRGDNKIAWYENTDGFGSFGPQQIISTETNFAIDVFAADIDGDGDIDVISASSFDDKVAWYENVDGLGTFGVQQVIATTGNPRSIFAVDIDGDGDLDVLTAFGDNDKIAWYENINGNGNFGWQNIITTNADNASSVFAADIDGDGDIDVLSASSGDNNIVWYENADGEGDFGGQQYIEVEAMQASSVFAVDIDGDGDIDVLSASIGDDKIAWYDNLDGIGDFGEQQLITKEFSGPRSTVSADIDGDGDMDVLSASREDNKIAWYENIDGVGTFGSQRVITIEANLAISVYIGDIDGDGDIDVLSASEGDNKIAWYENIDGMGNFGPQQVIATPSRAYCVFATDIDGDGDVDVLSASWAGDKIAWYENIDGNGSFGDQQVITLNADWAVSVFAADIDGDGDMDVLSASTDDNKVAWYENTDGTGAFGAQQIISSDSNSARSVFAADIDNDGDNDVLVGSYGIGKVSWYENTDGNGTFGVRQIISNNSDEANSIFATDIDGDGDLDVLSATIDNSKIAWYENTNGLGAFGSQQTISNYVHSAQFVFAADIDGDGDMDVMSASRYDDKIAWYENLGFTTNNISGKVRLDINQEECLVDGSPISNILISADNGSESFTTFSLDNGIYQLFPEAGNFTTTATLTEPYSTYYTITPDEYNNEFVDIGNTFNADFCLQSNGTFNDLNISILPLNEANPGFNAEYQVVYKNNGTTQLSGSIDFNYDNAKLTFNSASEIISAQTSNSISFDYLDLAPFECRTIDVAFTVMTPPIVEAGDIIDFEVTVNPVMGDETEEDNTYSFSQTAVGSYDPNDITCLEGEEILLEDANKYLHYLIRFQNTGDYFATFVRVHNTLHDNLDWNTIQMVSASHDYKVEIIDGNEVDFIFDAIYLQDSTTDETNSHGFVSYKIKPKSDVAIGDIISSQAGIYFDFNPVVNTNIFNTEIVDIIDINEPTLLSFSIYPTPTDDILNITSKKDISKVIIYNKLGKTVLETTENTIDVSTLVQGIYFVKVIDANGNAGVKKIVKK